MTFLTKNKEDMFIQSDILLALRLHDEDESPEIPLNDPDDEELSEKEDKEGDEDEDDSEDFGNDWGNEN